jgi:hypothetical protein
MVGELRLRRPGFLGAVVHAQEGDWVLPDGMVAMICDSIEGMIHAR